MKGLRERLLEKSASNLLTEAEPALVRDYYQGVLDSVDSVIYTVNRDLRITGVNRRWDDFALMNGGEQLVKDKILGTSLLDQMQGAPLERWRSVCPQILSGQLPHYLDEVASEDATQYAWRNFSLSARPQRDSDGEIMGITFVATNITQLKKAENEMFQRLVEIRGLQQVAHTAGAWVNRRQVYKQVTADIARLFEAEKCIVFLWDENSGNLQAREPAYGVAGRKLADLSLDMGHPADPDSLWTDLEEKDHILLNEGDEAPEDMAETSAQVDRLAAMAAVLRVSGRIHGLILVAGRERPFSQKEARLLSVFAVPMALSIENSELNRRLLDRTQQLAETRDELERIVSLKQAIRMPLSVVRGYLELFLDGVLGPLSDSQQAPMRVMLDKSQAISQLVGRISPHRFPHDAKRYEPIHLAGLVHMSLDRWQPALEEAGLRLVTHLPAPYDEASMTVGDPDMLLKVLDTLLDHAAKSVPSGEVVQVSLHQSHGIIYLKIANSGKDIPPDQLLHVWKSKDSTNGLAEVRRIVEGHGGQAWAESAPGEGCIFYVALRKLESAMVEDLAA